MFQDPVNTHTLLHAINLLNWTSGLLTLGIAVVLIVAYKAHVRITDLERRLAEKSSFPTP